MQTLLRKFVKEVLVIRMNKEVCTAISHGYGIKQYWCQRRGTRQPISSSRSLFFNITSTTYICIWNLQILTFEQRVDRSISYKTAYNKVEKNAKRAPAVAKTEMGKSTKNYGRKKKEDKFTNYWEN